MTLDNMKLQEELNNIRKKFLAFEYAYGMCGSSPCVDCNKFRHITTDEERTNFIKCTNEARCQEAKDYNEKYDNFVKEYLNTK
jgi:hypothetical protein